MSNGTTLVLGATGKTGRRVVPRLRLRGIQVRAASRSSRTRFGWSDPCSWDAALRARPPSTWWLPACPVRRISSWPGPRPSSRSPARPGGHHLPAGLPCRAHRDPGQAGLERGRAHHVTEMFALIERGLLAATTDGVATVLGRAPRTFEDHVGRTAAAGAGQR